MIRIRKQVKRNMNFIQPGGSSVIVIVCHDGMMFVLVLLLQLF